MPGLPRWIARALGAADASGPPRATPPPAPAPAGDTAGPATPRPLPGRIGPYRVDRHLGQGGMGVVYAAHDERLDRPVALKMIGALTPDESQRKRFAREARAAARVNHPHVCQIYEVGEDAGQPFIAMELLAGESLADRLGRSTVTLPETVTAGLQMLDALGALHAEGLVHRDLKPSNVFLGPRGVKLLDFGLARTLDSSLVADVTHSQLTRSGALVGTPRYMAPEQVYGQEVDARTDLFTAGAILFEMLAGRPAFPGRTVVEVLYATLHEHPPALTGSPAVVALDRVVRRALAKEPADRHVSAAEMAAELRAVSLDGAGVARARALTRVIVLPFRVLRPDPDTDFLAFSLADAITSSLTGRDPLVVRSSLVAQRFAPADLDLKRLAAEADVDRVITGTLLRSGDQIRVGAQLLEVPDGTVLWSHTAQAAAGDVFGIQDELVERVVASLAPAAGETPRQDVPRSARAYEFYLRANQLARDYEQLPLARDLYRECLDADPDFAPAWARIGRCHRLIGKYVGEPAVNLARAEEAFARALALNPDLPIAHKLYAHLEAEVGRAREAMVRLLGRAQVTRNDPEIFAGLVHVLRYAGLLEASVAAHDEARRLDPNASTSVAFTFWARGDYDRLIAERADMIDQHPRALALAYRGREPEALALIAPVVAQMKPPDQGRALPIRTAFEQLQATLEGRAEDALRLGDELVARLADPESWLLQLSAQARFGRAERALELLERAVAGGHSGVAALGRNPWLATIRDRPEFGRALERAAEAVGENERAFREAGGRELLGLA